MPQRRSLRVMYELACECGESFTSDDMDELVSRARGHATSEHGIELPAALLARLAQRGARSAPVPDHLGP